MRIAITGATGFLGRYLVDHFAHAGHKCRCWYRPTSDRDGIDVPTNTVEWIEGELCDADASQSLVNGCDAVIHSALYRPGAGFRGAEGDLLTFVEKNVGGTLQLVEAARAAKARRFIFISTCAVHERILDDRPLDEAHPLWPTSHYGAHKAAIEKFVHSYGLGEGYEICSLRPTGIYGRAWPAEDSRWFDLVRAITAGEPVHCERGGKEVHAADVARAAEILLKADNVAGEAYNCYDMYISEYDVAATTKSLTGSTSEISGEQPRPKHQINTDKFRALGMTFGGQHLLERTLKELVGVCGLL